MYGVAGERRLTELEMPWLDGYEGSKPVRSGNAASGQFQLDVYGEVFDALFQATRHGLAPREDGWQIVGRSCSNTSNRSGPSPTRESGRCAAGGSVSRTRR